MIRRKTVMLLGVAGVAFLAPASARSQVVHAKGIDSLHVKANVQVQFNTTSVDEEPSSEWLCVERDWGCAAGSRAGSAATSRGTSAATVRG